LVSKGNGIKNRIELGILSLSITNSYFKEQKVEKEEKVLRLLIVRLLAKNIQHNKSAKTSVIIKFSLII